MTGEPNLKTNPDLAGGEISGLIKAMAEYGCLMKSKIGTLPDGSLTPAGEHCFARLQDLEEALSAPGVEPESLADVAALVLHAKGQCLVAAEKSRDLDPGGH